MSSDEEKHKDDTCGCYARFVFKYPWLVILIALAVVVGLSGWALGMYGIEFAADYAYYIWSETEICDKWDAYAQATVDNYYTVGQKNESTETFSPQTIADLTSIVLYQREGKNMITAEAVQIMADVEDRLFADPGFASYCFKPASGTNTDARGCEYFTSVVNAVRAANGNTLVGLTDATLQAILTAQPIIRNTFFGAEEGSNTTYSTVARTMFKFGYPLAGYKNKADRYEEQTEKAANWAYGWAKPWLNMYDNPISGIRLYDNIQGVIDININNFIGSQVVWIAGSFVFVFVYAAFHLKSVFLSITGVIGIAMAMPLSYAILFCFIGIRHFDTFNVVVLFLICGIGADSLFIITDLFRQSEFVQEDGSSDLLERLRYTSSHSWEALAGAMATTAVSFLSLCLSYCRIMRFVGLFAFFVMLGNYVLSNTFYLAILALYHKNIKNWWSLSQTIISFFCKPKVTDTLSDESSSTVSSEKAEDSQKVEEDQLEMHEDIEVNESLFAFLKEEPPFNVNESHLPIHKYKGLERAMHNYVAVVDYHYRIPVVLVAILLTVGFGIFSQSMKPKVDNNFLPKDHKMQKGADLIAYSFQLSTRDFSADYVWGLTGKLDVDFADLLTHDYFGEPIYTGIDISDPATQQYLYDTVTELSTHTELFSGTKCFITLFKSYVEANSGTFPVPAADFNTWFANWRAQLGTQDPVLSSSTLPGGGDYSTIGFSYTNDTLRYISIKLDLMNLVDNYYTTIRTLMNTMEELHTNLTANAPAAIGKGYQTSRQYVLMETQEEFRSQAVRGALISIAFAVVATFIVTTSITYTLVFGVSIFAIILIILGFLYSLGWEIGINESIMISIAAGFSTDYIIHTIEGMVSAWKLSRLGRIQDTLALYGLPVTSSFITTVGAACFLYPTTVLLFPPFATFMIISATLGMLFGFVFTPAIASLITPTGTDSLKELCKHKQ